VNPRVSHQKTAAMTLVEVFVVIILLAVLAAMILPALSRAKTGSHFHCVNRLKELGLGYQVWAGDNGDKYPMEISVTNGGVMELATTGNVAAVFQVMSNELSTPILVHCPMDTEHLTPTNFSSDFTGKNISYFVGLNASKNLPNSILGGDDNLERGGNSIKAGVYDVTTNMMFFGSMARYSRSGNIVLADGSVQSLLNSKLVTQFSQTGLGTNRLAIP